MIAGRTPSRTAAQDKELTVDGLIPNKAGSALMALVFEKAIADALK